MDVSGISGGKSPVSDDVLSSHEHEVYPTNSLDENCIEYDFQTDRNYYVVLRQTSLALKLKLVLDRVYETYINQYFNDKVKADGKTAAEEEQEASIPLVTLVIEILHPIFPNVEVYINS